MPELPEVETTCRGIQDHITGKEIKQVVVRQAQLRYLIPKTFHATCSGNVVTHITRRAKYILIHFTENSGVLIHLGMSGSVRVLAAGQSQAIKKHDHVDFVFQNGTVLRYHDPRRFGLIVFAENFEQHSLLKKLGPEPLSDEFNVNYLYKKSRARKVNVKTFIMDQKMVVGVGNIYAAEALFLSGISPLRVASSISKKRYAVLVEKIKMILAQAIKQGGTTLKDFVNSEGKPGYFQQKLYVYGREGEPCINCEKPLKAAIISQRTSVYCKHCQT